MSVTVKATVLTKKGNYFEVMLPAKRIVCPRCDGVGTQFSESYSRGDYDTACEECHGKNVVLVVDEDALSCDGGLHKMRDRYYLALEKADRAAYERRMDY
jgi:DnaJ-class molecular chaperone